jgi:hypothetical protein
MSGCCETLMAMANARVASTPADIEIRKPA